MTATLNTMEGTQARIKTEVCDSAECPAKALYVILVTGKQHLTFCAHHFRAHEGSLVGHVIAFQDDAR